MVTVYSKNNCVQCKMTKRFLDSNNVAYREINLDEQPEYVDQVKELLQQNVRPKGHLGSRQYSQQHGQLEAQD